ncbi:hypothetical protein TNCT_319961 [Trichonephila clavata]|uniref:Uncharacterized protein n=1 Tax=Trichonephila clavata TaxID=2740835 RepID=A0A8X6H9H8_TRICU|nr:hypothetical protein TNCT_319961 [Trichonephila clavata]
MGACGDNNNIHYCSSRITFTGKKRISLLHPLEVVCICIVRLNHILKLVVLSVILQVIVWKLVLNSCGMKLKGPLDM